MTWQAGCDEMDGTMYASRYTGCIPGVRLNDVTSVKTATSGGNCRAKTKKQSHVNVEPQSRCFQVMADGRFCLISLSTKKLIHNAIHGP